MLEDHAATISGVETRVTGRYLACERGAAFTSMAQLTSLNKPSII